MLNYGDCSLIPSFSHYGSLTVDQFEKICAAMGEVDGKAGELVKRKKN